jgi:hypothetical protein
MRSNFSRFRRTFLKRSASGAAALMAAGMLPRSLYAKPAVWTNGTQINNLVDNLRVAFCKDTAIVNTGFAINWLGTSAMQQQNDAADAAVIKADLDRMAKALAQKADPNEAWAMLLRKPASKEWSAAKVAIKVNAIGCNHPRVAVVGKVCDELMRLGVTAQNIVIYDAIISKDDIGALREFSAVSLYDSFRGKGLPQNVVVSNGTGTFPVTLSVGTGNATTLIQNVDIIVNCSVLKHHDNCGGGTAAVKNHLGSLKCNWVGRPCPTSPDDLFGLFKTEVITGTPDPANGIPAKQQLCIVDSLWSNKNGGPWAVPDAPVYNYLVMGTFAPAVDFLTFKKILQGALGGPMDNAYLDRYMTDFGYTPTDITNILTKKPENNNGKGWVDAMTYVPPVHANARIISGHGRSVELRTRRNGSFLSNARITFSSPEMVFHASIRDISGKTVKTFSLPSEDGPASVIFWDGMSDSGRTVAAGFYQFIVKSAAAVRTQHITIW